MTLSKRQKVTITALLLYWPAIFILSHMPIPKVVMMARVSDKSIHFLAYFILVCLLWLAISPDKKVNWRKASVWWILVVVVWYGVIDEVLQSLVGRSCDIADFFADAAGAVSGLLLLSFLSFWPGSLAITAVTIFVLSSLAKANLFELVAVTNASFHFFGYAFFTMLWVRQLRFTFSLEAPGLKWFFAVFAGPCGLAAATVIFCRIAGKAFDNRTMVIDFAAIYAVAAGAVIWTFFKNKKTESSDDQRFLNGV